MIDTMRPTGDETEIGKTRDDLIRRLFAVAISIGFGGAIVQAKWVKCGTLPDVAGWHQICTVAVAMFATVLSWDGYLLSIKSKPLYDWLRFTIDVVLVFSYLFLFATSSHEHFLVPILAWCFTLYMIWDFQTTRLFKHLYRGELPEDCSTLVIYKSSLFQKDETNIGPIITIAWAIMLYLLVFVARWHVNHFFVCAIAISILVAYRADKKSKRGVARGFQLKNRLALMVSMGVLMLFAIGAGLKAS